MVRRAVRLSRQLAARRPFLRSPRQRARHGEGGRDRRELQLGRRSPAQRSVVGHGHLRGASARPEHAVRRHPPERARHLRGARRAEDHRSSAPARHHGGRAAADPRLRAGPLLCWRRACATTGATTRSASSRSSRAICRRTPRTKCASRCGGCMRPASRSFSTWSTTTPPKAARWARRCRSAASTIRAITGSSRTIRATASTTPAPATRSICRNARVLQMVMDSLRYWVTQFHVDGFRFDLGVTLGREPHGFDPGAGFFDALRQDPVLSRIKLISEPWDIGPGRLSARPSSAGVCRMERPLSRRHPPLLARRRGTARRDRGAHRRIERPVRSPRAPPVGVGELRGLA